MSPLPETKLLRRRNRFEDLASEAQKRRRRRLVLGFSTGAFILLVAILFIVITTYFDKLDVTVSPADAESTAKIDIVDGRGIAIGDTIVAIRETLNIRVSAAGFSPEEVEVGDATWRRGKLDVVLRALPAIVTADTVPEVSDIGWYLDESLIARTARLHAKVAAGPYTLSARHPHYQPVSQDVTLTRGQSLQLTLELVPIQGSVAVNSVPSGARVMLDGVVAGQTPLKVDIEGGEHELEIAQDGYVLHRDTFAITADNPSVSRHYELVRSDAEVNFVLKPGNGLLTVNNIVLPSGPSASIRLPIDSSHTVEYSKPGYQTKRVEFTVKPNSANSVSLELQAVYGIVEIMSEPVAEVSVGGTVIGQTPMQLRLQAFEQSITLSRAGYVSETRTIIPDESSVESVYVTLEPEQSHRLKTATDIMTNSIGMEFRLFRSRASVAMGSIRGEPGSRANEFAREVHLTRPFYAGLYEVTVEQYRQFAQSGQPGSGSRQPVTGISWIQAAEFCNWLSTKEGLKPVYHFAGSDLIGSDATADGYRMLTEAEWEWLARKAGRTQEVTFPWGNKTTIPPDSGNLADESARGSVSAIIPRYDDGQSGLSDTGVYKPNSVGIHDLAGNVSEWTHDSYSLAPPVSSAVETDPFDKSTSAWRTVKGSNWRSAALEELRVAYRRGSSAGDDTIGFRLARYLY